MFFTAASPNRSRNCARYRLAGVTGSLAEKNAFLAVGLVRLALAADGQIQGSGRHLDLQMFHGAIPHDAPADGPAVTGAGAFVGR